MKSLLQLSRTLTLVLALSFSAGFARAEYFSFSYLFGDGLTVTGSFNGDLNGNFAENINGLSVFFNGEAMTGSLFASRFDSGSYFDGPIISFDALQNNFTFANSDFANGDFTYDSVFYILNASVYSDTAVAFSSLGYASQDDPTVSSSWRLAVPDHGSSLALLGLTMLGLLWLRRKQSQVTAC